MHSCKVYYLYIICCSDIYEAIALPDKGISYIGSFPNISDSICAASSLENNTDLTCSCPRDLVSFGIMGIELKASLKPRNTIVCGMYGGFQGRPKIHETREILGEKIASPA